MQFQFKKFTISQRDDVFKFGTDAALLATWIKSPSNSNVLEIGTGTGVITLMVAQRESSNNFTGIDISKAAIELANDNLKNFPILSTINFTESPIQKFTSELKFDVIVSNPPFFENATKSPYALKNAARHTDTLSLHDLLFHSKRLLLKTGTINLIYPIRYLNDIISVCNTLNLYPILITKTRSTASKPIKRVLISIGKTVCEPKYEELIINGSEKGYSPGVYKMLHPFLIKL